MNSEKVVELLNTKLSGQQLLFDDPEFVLRNTSFKSTGCRDTDKQILVYWWMNVHVPDGIGQNNTEYCVYKTWSNALYNYFKYAKISGMYSLKTNQNLVQLSCHKNDILKLHIEELEMWIPNIKTLKDENGVDYKYISILEYSLSQYGVYSLGIYDNFISLDFCSYGRTRTLERFNRLCDAVEHIKNNVWYQE